MSNEALALTLEQSTDYKILRRLNTDPRKLIMYEGPVRRGLLVDVETTGLDPLSVRGEPDEIIEIAVLPFSYVHDGIITELHEPFCALREPTKKIPPAVTALTGLTDEIVRGHTIDPADIVRLLTEADVVIAHNASFDRPFCEKLHAKFATIRWGCSQTEVPWAAHGHSGLKLAYLLAGCGSFYDGHRARGDVFALAEILTHPLGATGQSAFSFLIESAFQSSVRVYAERAPYERKDQLRARSYRWNAGENGQPRAWYRDLPEADLGRELDFLYAEILPHGVEPIIRRIDAIDRFSTRC